MTPLAPFVPHKATAKHHPFSSHSQPPSFTLARSSSPLPGPSFRAFLQPGCLPSSHPSSPPNSGSPASPSPASVPEIQPAGCLLLFLSGLRCELSLSQPVWVLHVRGWVGQGGLLDSRLPDFVLFSAPRAAPPCSPQAHNMPRGSPDPLGLATLPSLGHDFPSLQPTPPAHRPAGREHLPRGPAGGNVGVRTDRHLPRQQQAEEEDPLSGASLPTRSAQGLLGGPAEDHDSRRGGDTSNSCCAGLGSVQLSGTGAEAGRVGKEGRISGVQRAGQRAARSRGRRLGLRGKPPRGCRRPG